MRAAVLLSLVALAGAARAEPTEPDRFFADKPDGDRDKSLWQGSLVLSSFGYAETSDQLELGLIEVPLASPYRRVWGEARLQLDGRHLKGGRWDARVDGRARYVASRPGDASGDPNRIQSGLLGANEYDVRELYLVRAGKRSDLFLGRLVIADLGALRVDGMRLDYAKNARWTYLGFLGLHPARGSRSLATDYPVGIDKMNEATGRVLPVTGGFGAAYRTDKGYGSLGAVTIVPTSRDGGAGGSGTYERARVYLAAQGYWRSSPRLDLWHYVVLDVYGTAGFAPTNASVGLQYKPGPRLRTQLAVNQIDTEALNVQVRGLLENDAPSGGPIVNNFSVQRIGNTMVRGAVSALLGKHRRWELTAALHGRRRPDVTFTTGATPQVLPAAQSLEVHAGLVDHGFYRGIRAELAYSRSVSIGDASYARSIAQVVRLGGTREWGAGRTLVTADLTWLSSADDNAGASCTPGAIATCYGSANTNAFQLNGQGYYRWKENWYVTGSLGLGLQRILATDPVTNQGIRRPSITTAQAFARVGYRF